ncbi:MAG: 5-formyltetrahydrofolate cyclo-ligase [Paracoccaceae bacterium]
MSRKSDISGGFASPPCFAHELAATGAGYVAADPEATADTARWRKSKREALIAARLAVPADERARVAGEVAEVLDRLIAPGPGRIISLYWPFRGELDLRDWMRSAHERGARIALPVVVEKAQPLIFREWLPGCRMERGVWNIPIPAEDNRILPNVVISPLVGYDPSCFRLGYGGGFYDRTLAGMIEQPLVIGVGLPIAALSTIFPQPFDIPMDVIVTGKDRVLTLNAG